MPIDFPNSPTVGQTFTSGVRSWTWTGTVWDLTTYGAQGPTGPQGVTGPQGNQGPAGSNPIPEDDQLVLAYQVFS